LCGVIGIGFVELENKKNIRRRHENEKKHAEKTNINPSNNK